MAWSFIGGVITGGVIAAGGAAHYIINKDRTSKDTVNSDCNDAVRETGNTMNHTETSEKCGSAELGGVKSDAAEKMNERHREAEKIIKESVRNIFGDAEAGETKNEDIKKKLFEDIDSM